MRAFSKLAIPTQFAIGVSAMLFLFVADVTATVALIVSIVGAYGIGAAVLSRVLQFDNSEDALPVVLRTVSGIVVVSLGTLAIQPLVSVRVTSAISLVIGLLIVAFRMISQRKAAVSVRESQKPNRQVGELLAVFVIAFLYLGRDFRWANTAFVGALLTMFVLSRRMENRALRLAALAVGCSAVVLSAVSRGSLWWYVTNDHHWFEAIGDSVALFGPWDQFGVNADVGLRYHFLSYLISAILGGLFSLEPFLVLTRGLPVLIAVSISATFWSILSRFTSAQLAPRLIGAAFVPFLFQYSHASPSHTFGVLLLMLLMSVVLQVTILPSLTPQLMFGCVAALALSLTKASVVPPAVLGIVAVAVLARYRRHAADAPWFAVSFSTVSVAYVIWQLLSSRASDQLETGELFGYAIERSGDLRTLGYTKMGVASMIFVTSVLFVPLVLSWRITQVRESRLSLHFQGERLVWFVAPTVAYGLALAVLRGNHSIGYFVWAALYVMVVPMLLVVVNTIEKLRIERSRWTSVTTILWVPLIVWLSQQLMLPRFNGGEHYEILLRSILKTPWIVPLVVLSVIQFCSRVRSSNYVSDKASVLVAWTVIAIVAPTITNPYSLEKGPDAVSSELAMVIGSDDEIAVGKWLKNNVSMSAVLATNHFCGSECTGSGWFRRDVELPRKGFQFVASPTQYGGANFFLAIYSQRRFLAQGTYHLLAAGSDRQLLIDRVESTLEFIENPMASTYSKLRALGATHVVVDKSVTASRDWGSWVKQRYSNRTFVVLELTA